jgi:hypothetical protein
MSRGKLMKLQNIFIESLQSLPNNEESKRDINKNEAQITDILNEYSYDNHDNSQNNIKGNYLNNDKFKDKLTNDFPRCLNNRLEFIIYIFMIDALLQFFHQNTIIFKILMCRQRVQIIQNF